MKSPRFFTVSALLAGAAILILQSAPAIAAEHKHASPPAGSAHAEYYAAMAEAMAVMDRDMMAAAATGDVDRDFAAMMIPHHQGAVDMARGLLLHGRDPVLRRLAQEIITTQQVEIDVMRRRLAATAPVAPAKLVKHRNATFTQRASPRG